MTITETLRRLAEKAYAHAHDMKCDPQTIIALVIAVEAAQTLRDATRKYEAVSARLMTTDTSEWQEASREQLQAERDLDAALEALARVEG